ncbi:MAG: hypothetical protein WKG07_15950 [Hymenobacter sp.]
MQTELDAAVLAHGQHPYRWRELWQRMKENRRFFPFFLPFAWPAVPSPSSSGRYVAERPRAASGCSSTGPARGCANAVAQPHRAGLLHSAAGLDSAGHQGLPK